MNNFFSNYSLAARIFLVTAFLCVVFVITLLVLGK